MVYNYDAGVMGVMSVTGKTFFPDENAIVYKKFDDLIGWTLQLVA